MNSIIRGAAALLLIGIAFNAPAREDQWRPLSSETLVKMPAGYLSRYVDQDFNASPLAQNIESKNKTLAELLSRMGELRQQVTNSQGEQQLALRHQLLLAKSNYLDAIEEKQRLDRLALDKKSRLYQSVLQNVLEDQRYRHDPVSAELIQNQQAARSRMERTVSTVDGLLAAQPDMTPSEYSQQYRENLSKVEALKTAIANHMANASPMIDGRDVSREEYVRHLLAGIESERSLLDQEQLMLGYMARLVALDAHALEQELALGGEPGEVGPDNTRTSSRLADAVDRFIN
ncbi:MAG: hypothetical protein SV765_08970 [Pseudomonadota bacterium]|nr:hypothetical protein [Pseudomonadota bacterium]